MTWAINEGYPYLPDRQAVLEFISNIGQVLSPPAIPQPLQARPPTKPYPDDLLPLIQQLAWKLSETPSRDPSVAKFLFFIFLVIFLVTLIMGVSRRV